MLGIGISSTPKTMAKSVIVRPEPGLSAETVVGQSVRIEGDLISEGDIKIDGTVRGLIKTSRNLYVGPQARIEADVEAGAATIAGVVEGDLKVAGLVAILQTGFLNGNVTCRKLAVEDGAYFDGQCKMVGRETDKSPDPASAD